MIKVLVCDDQKYFLYEVEKAVNQYYNKEAFSFSYYFSGEQMLADIKGGEKPDILIMDIELEDGINGIRLSNNIKNLFPEVITIYVSGYDSYTYDLLEGEPFAFLHKPVQDTYLFKALDKAKRRIDMKSALYYYMQGGVKHFLKLRDVMYFYSRHRVVIAVKNTGEEICFYQKLDDVEAEIKNVYTYFVRIAKGFLVNCNYLKHFERESVTLENGITLKISRNYRKALKEIVYTFR